MSGNHVLMIGTIASDAGGNAAKSVSPAKIGINLLSGRFFRNRLFGYCKLFDIFGVKRRVVEVHHFKDEDLNIYDGKVMGLRLTYHQIYTDGQCIYDPRLSSSPLPQRRWRDCV